MGLTHLAYIGWQGFHPPVSLQSFFATNYLWCAGNDVSLVPPRFLPQHELQWGWADCGRAMASVLDVQNLQVSYRSREVRPRPVLSGVSFDLRPGEILGVLGESGSGKSTLARRSLRLRPPNGHIGSGAVFFEGKNLFQATSEELRQIRGARIALIFQEPSLALHPTLSVLARAGPSGCWQRTNPQRNLL